MNKQKFYDHLRSSPLFTSLSPGQVKGMEGVIDAFKAVGDRKIDTLGYSLATCYHETAGLMVPTKETVMPHHRNKNPSDEEVCRRLDNWAKRIGRTTNIYWRKQPNGKYYFGRGQVQITWEDNYRASSKDAGVDLVSQPEAMLDPLISSRILILGLIDGRWNGQRKGIQHYLKAGDLRNARRTVNITDKWQIVASHHKIFMEALEAAKA